MASIEVNEELLDIKISADSSLESIIPKVAGRTPYKNYKLVSIVLNGSPVEPLYDKASLARPLCSEDHIQLTLDGDPNLDLIEHIEDLSQSIINKISEMDLKDEKAYNSELAGIIAGVEILIRSTSFIVRKFQDKDLLLGELPIKNLQIHLLSVLKAIETAHNSKDIVMLEDLLEFELKDNLTKWKILVTPALKIQAQNLF